MIIDEQLIRDLSRWLSYKDGESLLFPSLVFQENAVRMQEGTVLSVIS
jgi:hypothetical protein